MKSQLLGALCAGIFSLALIATADAALISRLGGQAVYDTDFDITWLADANLAASNTFGLPTNVNLGTHPSDSSGVSGIINIGIGGLVDGSMNWPGALHWIDAMNSASYLGFNGWRLPTALNQSGSGPCGVYNCTDSEMGHLFYNEFGAAANTSVLATGSPTALANFTNVETSRFYWFDTVFNTENTWFFNFGTGAQSTTNKGNNHMVWAIGDGDVFLSSVPIPASFWLFGSGLLILARRGLRRR